MKYLLLILLILTSGCSNIKFKDVAHVTANALIVADWNQTLEIADNPNYYETNKILGKYPKEHEVNRYFISCLVLYNTAYYVLPEKYQTPLALGVVTIQAWTVNHNYRAGINIKF